MADVWFAPCPCCRLTGQLTPSGKPPVIQVVNSRANGGTRVRYLGCRICGYRPKRNKRTVAIEFAPSRRVRLAAS